MEFTFIIDDVEKSVTVEKKNDVYVFSIGEREYVVSASPLANGTLTFFIDNRSYIAVVSQGEAGTSIGLNGRNFLVRGEEDAGSMGASHGSGHGDGSVESPMPGNIVAVNVSEGDHVKSGEALLVIESMKMQNEITAPLDGRILKVGCSVGDQVNFGDVLVEIEPA